MGVSVPCGLFIVLENIDVIRFFFQFVNSSKREHAVGRFRASRDPGGNTITGVCSKRSGLFRYDSSDDRRSRFT